ncbi:MAG: M28 family peptidase [Methylococcaceae bacterium]|nr:M28 family peptidase [Methylococcaceae bacterium]
MQSPLRYSLQPTAVSWAIMIVILALCWVGLKHASPPFPRPASSLVSEFSSARAMRYLRSIAQKAHPTGTTENDKVRNYLVTELKALGLEPQIQSAFAINNQGKQRTVGYVNNILVRIPGSHSGKALLLAAHYDSTHTGPGAADDGASVAAILETLRALKNLPRLQNDLICLFSDGEEAGLLGAEAFVAEHPWAKGLGLALNFEYRGNSGPVVMFETSPKNGNLIKGLANTPHPLGNSLMYEVYKRLPNDTDMSVFKRTGIAGMNYAAIEGYISYHTQLDRPELMQEASLQHLGETMLNLVQYFGHADLDDLQTSDCIYFDFPVLGLVSYPVSWVRPLCIGLTALFSAVLTLGIRRGQLRAKKMMAGALVFILLVVLLALMCQLLWLFILSLNPQYETLLQGDTYNSYWYLLAFVTLVITAFGVVQARIIAWISPLEFTCGAMSVWLLLLIASSIALPGASFLFLWPLAPALLATALLFWADTRPVKLVIMIAGVSPGILMLTPFIKALFVGLTANQIGLVMIFLTLFLGLLTPLLDLLMRTRLVPPALVLTGICSLLTAEFNAGFDAEHPRPNHLFYAQNAVTNHAFWLSRDTSLDEWTRTFFPSTSAKRHVPEIFGEQSQAYWVGTAPALPLPAPTITVLSDHIQSGNREISIQITSLRHAPELQLSVEGVRVLGSKIENRIFSENPDPAWKMKGVGFSEKPLNVALTVEANSPFKIRVIDFSYELPNTPFPPRPPDMIPQPFGFSDTTAVTTQTNFN